MAPDNADPCESLSRAQEGWNTGDGRMLAASCAEDADFVVINSTFITGREAITAGHQQIVDTRYKDSHLSTTIEDVRFVRPDLVIIRVRSRLRYDQDRALRGRSTWVSIRDNGEWQVVAFQNTPNVAFDRENATR